MMKRALTQLIGAAILLVVLLGAYGAWFYAVSQQSAQMNLLASQIQTSTQDAARVAAAKMALQQLSANESAVYDHFVSTNDVVPFLESLQSTGSSLGTQVQVSSVSAGQPDKNGRGQITLSLQVVGSFDAVMRTLGALEYSPYDLQVTSLSLSTGGAQGKSARQWTAGATFTVATLNRPSQMTGTATSTTPVHPVSQQTSPASSSASAPSGPIAPGIHPAQ